MNKSSSDQSRLLIVDDEPDVTNVLKIGLEHHGFHVDVYNDPVVALANLNGKIYDVAIFDVNMPRMNGFELYRQFRKMDGRTFVCFFTASGTHMSEFQKTFPNFQVVTFLNKPMEIAQLSERLTEIIRSQQDEVM